MSVDKRMIGADYATQSGISASNDEVVFKITTNDAKKYLQSKMNLITERMREAGRKNNIPDLIDAPDIHVELVSYPVSSYFIPFVIVLSEDVLENPKQNKNTPEIFNTDKKSGVKLKKSYWDLLQLYMYTDDEMAGFNGLEWRRRSKATKKGVQLMRKYLRPKQNNFNGNKTVVVVLDPLKLFHDMLEVKEMKQRYLVNIKKWDKIDTSNFSFIIHRTLDKKKPKAVDVLEFLNANLRDEAFNKK